MKTLASLLSTLVATGSVAVALLTLTSLMPADLGFASLIVLGIAGFALFDYRRPVRSLHVKAPVLRPVLPTESVRPIVYDTRRAA